MRFDAVQLYNRAVLCLKEKIKEDECLIVDVMVSSGLVLPFWRFGDLEVGRLDLWVWVELPMIHLVGRRVFWLLKFICYFE